MSEDIEKNSNPEDLLVEIQTKYEKLGNAGIEGVLFQINLLTVFMLNALETNFNWRLSTENKIGAKFDDIIFEKSNEAILLQAKHIKKASYKIKYENLFSINSKNDNFSLAKYFFSYHEVKGNFKSIKNVIICTNANIEVDEEETNPKCLTADDMLYFDGTAKICHTFQDKTVTELEESIRLYYNKNLQRKNVSKDIISKENIKDFLKHLHFVANYPSGDKLKNIIENKIIQSKFGKNLNFKVASNYIFDEMLAWYKKENGIYLNPKISNSIFSKIVSHRYCESLDKYEVFFQDNSPISDSTKQIIHIVPRTEDLLLYIMKVYRAVQQEEALFVPPDAEDDIQHQIIEAFEIPRYKYLVLIRDRQVTQRDDQVSSKIKKSLDTSHWKKIILVAKEKDIVAQQLKNTNKKCYSETKYEDILFTHLAEKIRNKFSKKIVAFQGMTMTLGELLPTYDLMNQVLTCDVLGKLARNEILTIGMEIDGLNENYISRSFKRFIHTVNEVEILEKNVVLISSSAGIGKSTILKRLAIKLKKSTPNLWIIPIDLNGCTKFLTKLQMKGTCQIDVLELLNSQEATKLNSDLEKTLFQMTNRVALFVDAVDEISPHYENIVLNLLKDCKNRENFAKIFVTTRPHMQENLEKILYTKAWDLEPLSTTNQRDFLKNYWTQNLNIQDPVVESKCEYYANALLDTLCEWIKVDSENDFAGNPLQTRMLAEVFQERKSFDDELGEWEDCKQFITSNNEEPKLPEKINLVKLYQMFIDKKRNIFVQEKGNPNGNVIAEEVLKETFKQWYDFHYILALEQVIGSKRYCETFSCYKRNALGDPEEKKLLRAGITQNIRGRTSFVHRTFAEYFVAECILYELKCAKGSEAFFNMLLWHVFSWENYALVRTFLDYFLKNQASPYPQSSIEVSISRNHGYLHTLSRDGHAGILRFIFNNIRYTKKLPVCCFTWKVKNITIDVDTKDFIGRTSLQDAAQKGRLDVVELLVENGANINNKDGRDSTALLEAAEGLHFDVVKYLVKNGADVNSKDKYGNTPIIEASRARHVAMVWFLLQHGADPTITNKLGVTVIHFFIRKAQFKLLKNLLERGVNANTKNSRGCTPLQLAVVSGELKIIKLLVKHGADVNAISDENCISGCRFGWLQLHGDKRWMPSGLVEDHAGGFTALHLAVGLYDSTTVKFLVENGADINCRDRCGCTPLIVAARKGFLDIVKILVGEHANLDIQNEYGRTALHYAAANLKIFQLLANRGANQAVKDRYGHTPLDKLNSCNSSPD